MIRPANSVSVTPLTEPLPIRAVLAVSSRGFIAIWWLVQSLHVAFIVYSVSVIKLHRYFIVQHMEVTIDYMGPTVIGFFDAVIVGHGVLIVCHCLAFMQSVWWSLYYRQWRFVCKSKAHRRRNLQRRNTLIKQTILSTNSVTGSGTKTRVVTDQSQTPILRRLLLRGIQATRKAGLALFGRFGIFGVEGTYYESSFFAMEVVEIALQIFQAYKLSQLVSRVWINRLNAVVLILNCWSTAFVHQFLHGDRLVKRVVLLVVDAIFDTVSSMVIPLVIIYPYYMEFDISRRDFPLVNYYHDIWLIQAISENRQVFVTSWIDYISKLMPGVTVFGGMLVLKQYVVMDRTTKRFSARELLALHAQTSSGTRVRSTFMIALKAMLPTAQTQVKPFRTIAVSPRRTGSTVNVIEADDGNQQLTRGERLAVTTALFSKYKNKWQHLFLFLSGLAILVIHIHSTTVAVLSHTRGCLLEVRPWFATSYTCVALEINCASGEFDDGADVAALESQTQTLLPSALKSLIFASCARLHVPPMIQRFPGLQMIKIYNTTVVQWDATAELRADLHSDLQLLYISDSNFSGSGDLPIGLLGDKFPPTLVDIEFSGTNLVHLPSTLHEKWTKMQFFVLERNVQITEFPAVLLKMKIPQLYLGSNGITTIPNGLLADQAFWTLNLNGNPLQALPDTIGDLSAFYRVGAAHTNVSVLPPWLVVEQYDPVTGKPFVPFLGYAKFLAGGTPLCEDAEKKETATKTMQEWVVLNCSASVASYVYPINDERKWRAASLANLS